MTYSELRDQYFSLKRIYDACLCDQCKYQVTVELTNLDVKIREIEKCIPRSTFGGGNYKPDLNFIQPEY